MVVTDVALISSVQSHNICVIILMMTMMTMMTIYILWWSVCLMFYPHFPLYHKDEDWDVYCYLCMIGGVCLSVFFFTFYPHFLEWCVFGAERQRREARHWENSQMYQTKLCEGGTINPRPILSKDGYGLVMMMMKLITMTRIWWKRKILGSTISLVSLNAPAPVIGTNSQDSWAKMSCFGDLEIGGSLNRPDFHCLAHFSATILQC